jgi:hypothetical protein
MRQVDRFDYSKIINWNWTDEEKRKFFQRVRDEISERIERFAKTGE